MSKSNVSPAPTAIHQCQWCPAGWDMAEIFHRGHQQLSPLGSGEQQCSLVSVVVLSVSG